VIELVHDERQVHALHPSMIAPGFSQRVGAIVAGEPDLVANS